MSNSAAAHQPATRPEDPGRFFTERGNAGDVEGLVALYEPDQRPRLTSLSPAAAG